MYNPCAGIVGKFRYHKKTIKVKIKIQTEFKQLKFDRAVGIYFVSHRITIIDPIYWLGVFG